MTFSSISEARRRIYQVTVAFPAESTVALRPTRRKNLNLDATSYSTRPYKVISVPLESMGMDLNAFKYGLATITETCANFPLSPAIGCQMELSYQFDLV